MNCVQMVPQSDPTFGFKITVFTLVGQRWESFLNFDSFIRTFFMIDFTIAIQTKEFIYRIQICFLMFLFYVKSNDIFVKGSLFTDGANEPWLQSCIDTVDILSFEAFCVFSIVFAQFTAYGKRFRPCVGYTAQNV